MTKEYSNTDTQTLKGYEPRELVCEFRKRVREYGQRKSFQLEAVSLVREKFAVGDRFLFECAENRYEWAGRTGTYGGITQRGSEWFAIVEWDKYTKPRYVRIYQFAEHARRLGGEK